MLSNDELLELEELVHSLKVDQSKIDLFEFTSLTFEKFKRTKFHETYYRILTLWAIGKIKKLIVTVPPQHGKSEGSTRRLPAFCFGLDPDQKIAIASYNTPFAQKFNRDIQRIIDTPLYNEIFSNIHLNSSNIVTVKSSSLRNANEFEIVGHTGSLKAVGRGGGITGNPVDKMIMDDLYKDSAEGNSPVIRDAVWEWYTGAVTTRLHNNSQQLIVFTRWHEEDLIGILEKKEKVITLETWDQLTDLDPDTWVKINFEAIKTGKPTEIDPRQEGEPLFPERHNLNKLLKDRGKDPLKFECMFQGNPTSAAGQLYGKNWKTYIEKPEAIVRKNYTDTADTGDDFLCSIDYDVAADGLCYVVDVIYTDQPMEVTEPLVAGRILRNGTPYADIESNNGGRSFARKIQGMVAGKCTVTWFHQSGNKESRIVTNAATVMQKIVFPDDWHIRWPLFYTHVVGFKRKFSANRHDDAPDTLTGIIEHMHEIPTGSPFVDVDDL